MAETRKILLPLFIAAALSVIISCASGRASIPEDLKPAEFFKRAQEASDVGNYKAARHLYEVLIERYPDDAQNVIAAQYELAFISYRLGETEHAKARFKGIIAQYEADTEDVLPRWPLILSKKLLNKIETGDSSPIEGE